MTAFEPRPADVPVCRHSWIWLALGPAQRQIDVHGDPSLAHYLGESGIDVTVSAGEGSGAAEAVVTVVGNRPDLTELRRRSHPARPEQVVAIAIGGGGSATPAPTHALVRAIQLIGSLRDATASFVLVRRLLKDLRRAGLSTRAFATGDRSRKHGLGRGGWLARRRLPVGWIVVATSGGQPRSALDVALASAEAALGEPLRPLRIDVFESGKILVRARNTAGESFYVKLAGGRLAPRLDAAQEHVAAIAACDLAGEVRARLVAPEAHGTAGPVRYVVEREAVGTHARSLVGARTRAALDFLGDLRRLDGPDVPSAAAVLSEVDRQIQIVGARVRPDELETLTAIRDRLEPALERVPLGLRHGDFWSENLLYRDDDLTAVLDWEWASFQSLPIFDVLDLLSTSEWRHGRRSFGSRIVDVLLPLAGRADHRLRAQLEHGAAGVEQDRETLLTLVAAYWLDRIARDLSSFPADEQAKRWREPNIERPLTAIARAFASSAGLGHSAPRAAPVRRARGSEDIVVLCYHGTSPTWQSELSVTPEGLGRHVEVLLGKGYRAATFRDAILTRSFPKTFSVTFDDAYLSVFEHAFPVLSSLDVPATVFVPTDFPATGRPMSWPGIEDWLGTTDESELRCMSWEQLRELQDGGWEVGSHTCTHPHLTRLGDAELADELRRSRAVCEQELGTPCLSIAYPYSDVDARVAAAAGAAGYRLGATLPVGFPPANLLRWPRVGMYGSTSALMFQLKISRRVRAIRRRYAPLARTTRG